MTDTSSIGPQWPPRRTSHRRIKGIDNRGIVRTGGHLLDLLAAYEEQKGRLGGGRGPDRLSIRALIDEALLRDRLDLLTGAVEVALPLEGCRDDLAGTWLVYLGWNAPSRQPDEAELAQAEANVAAAATGTARPHGEILARVRQGGYRLRVLPYADRVRDPELQRRVARLYGRFGWSLEQVGELLRDPQNLIAAAFDETGVPVSAGIGELSSIPFLDGTELRIAELTEASTLADHRGRGLYTGVAATLMAAVAEASRRGAVLGGGVDLVFGEASGHDVGVLHASVALGRTFARTAARDAGFPFRGVLPQHVPIAGAERVTPYHDLFPSFVSRRQLDAAVAE